MGFVGRIINKMADKMAAACQFALVDTLTYLVDYHNHDFLQILYINFFNFIRLMSEYQFCPMNKNKDGRQN